MSQTIDDLDLGKYKLGWSDATTTSSSPRRA